MFELILIASLTPASMPVAQFQPCVWPNKCNKAVETAVEPVIKTCDWPNTCA